MLFQSSLESGQVPEDWRKANVAPVYKKGCKVKAENYRPISLTCVTCKIMEHVIASSLMSFFDDNKVLTDVQHGFRRKRSCESQLISTIDFLAKSLDNKQQIDAILLDFSKAFDLVPHHRLLS